MSKFKCHFIIGVKTAIIKKLILLLNELNRVDEAFATRAASIFLSRVCMLQLMCPWLSLLSVDSLSRLLNVQLAGRARDYRS
jgi:hypothetical protein